MLMKWMQLRQLNRRYKYVPAVKETYRNCFCAILMATIKNGLSLLNVNTFWLQVVIGFFILFAVAFDRFTAKRASLSA